MRVNTWESRNKDDLYWVGVLSNLIKTIRLSNQITKFVIQESGVMDYRGGGGGGGVFFVFFI